MGKETAEKIMSNDFPRCPQMKASETGRRPERRRKKKEAVRFYQQGMQSHSDTGSDGEMEKRFLHLRTAAVYRWRSLMEPVP